MGDWNEAVFVIQGTVEITEEQTVAKKSDGDPKKQKNFPFLSQGEDYSLDREPLMGDPIGPLCC